MNQIVPNDHIVGGALRVRIAAALSERGAEPSMDRISRASIDRIKSRRSDVPLNARMSIREVFARSCRDGRSALDLSQQEVADAVGVHRGYLANVEAARVNLSVDQMTRLAEALGQRLELVVHSPTFVSARPNHDAVHAWCSGYVTRRLTSASWLVAREVDVSDGQVHGWIDVVAFDPRSATLALIEIKTRLDDFGAAERQIGWYERHWADAVGRLRWRPRRFASWLLGLASVEVDVAIGRNRDIVDHAYPGRANDILGTIGGQPSSTRRAIALIDPASRRQAWLIRTRLDGRRLMMPYQGYADAAARLSRKSR